MIVEFSVKNFRSIKEMQTISFVATGLKSTNKNAEVDENNIVEKDGLRLLKTVGIYGANASGKTNVLKALSHFIEVIRSEPSSSSNLSQLCQPFYYQEKSQYQESFFQIVLIVMDQKYRYGFTLKKADKEQNGNLNQRNHTITHEWLYGKKEKNIRLLFKRQLSQIENKMPDNDKIPNSIAYDHTLFLSHAAAFNENGICKKIKDFLMFHQSNLTTKNEYFRYFSTLLIQKKLKKEDFLKFLSIFNLRYEDVIFEKKSESDRIHPMEKIFLRKNNVLLNLRFDESAGTQKLFDLAGLLLGFFKVNLSPLIILDEIDSNFHPSLVIKLVNLFNDPKMNESNAQVLFTSHDTNLMSPSIMRRDQFYFTEKNEDDSTRLYSLADLKGIRNDADFARQYLAGYYGAVPILKDYVAPEIAENE